MAMAKRVRSTPRADSSSKIRRTNKSRSHKSEIIKQCVIYLQCKAAFKAGFDADTTGDGIFAGAQEGGLGSRPFSDAEKAIRRLTALSPLYGPGGPKLRL